MYSAWESWSRPSSQPSSNQRSREGSSLEACTTSTLRSPTEESHWRNSWPKRITWGSNCRDCTAFCFLVCFTGEMWCANWPQVYVVGENSLVYFGWFALLFVPVTTWWYEEPLVHLSAYVCMYMYCTYVLYVCTMISCFYACSHDVHVYVCRVVSLWLPVGTATSDCTSTSLAV